MAPEWIYLLKVNVGIALFYAFYKLFCQRDTFFQWRRFALLSFLGISFVYPLLNIQHWVKEQPAMYELADYYANLMMDETAAVTPTVVVAPQLPSLMTIGMYIYIVGVIVLSLRFIIQLFSIFRMRWIGKPVYLNGQRVISLPSEANPFSFFGWIFVYLPQLNGESDDEILTHEKTHAQQWHSMDVIISEIINIFCWFNPFSWLLKTEIRLNLEYLADNKVAETISNCKQYQYHLLGLAHTKRQTGLCNNFNVSHLKRRIIMMNKKRTRTAGRIKYALFAPLAAALLLVSNIEAVARTAEKAMKSVEVKSTPQQGVVFQVVEEMPEFPGGLAECMKFLGQNVKYPADCMKEGIQGRVTVQFIVERDGSITNPEVVKSVHPSLDKEALRVAGIMPKWKPGKQRGKVVRVRYTIPIMFRLDKPEAEAKAGTAPSGNKPKPEADANGIYRVCDEMPEFPGGVKACMEFIGQSIKYPKDCMEASIQGRVITQFIVDKDGSIKNVKVVRGIHPSLDKEAIRVAEAMPKWKAGVVEGKNVPVMYTVPITFRLDKPTATTGNQEAK